MQKVQQTIDLLKSSNFFYTIIVGMDSTYHYISPSYDENFNIEGESLAGKPFHITLHPDDIAVCQEAGEKCFIYPDQLHEAVLRKNDGHGGYIHTHWEFKALVDAAGLPTGIFCIGYNITKHIEAQDLIKTKSTQLEDISFMQSHVIRKPLANIIGLAHAFDGATTVDELLHIKTLLLQSAEEMDDVIKKIVNIH